MSRPDTKEYYENYTDEELAKAWNHLQNCKWSEYVIYKMDLIEEILMVDRRVFSWDENGNITSRWEDDT